MLNKKQFVELISSIAEIFGKDLSSYTIKIYYEIFKKYPFEKIEQAFKQAVMGHKYNTMPKPAEILEHLELSLEDKALYAWNTVIETIRSNGYYDSVEFEDKVIHTVIEILGGWEWLCDQEKDEMKFIGKEFIRLYKLYAQNPKKAPQRLVGFFERNNRNKGLIKYIPEIVFIPDGSKEFKRLTDKEKYLNRLAAKVSEK